MMILRRLVEQGCDGFFAFFVLFVHVCTSLFLIRRLAIACTNAPGSSSSSRSHSSLECEPVTRREDPTLCHVHWQSSRQRSARQRPGRPTRTRHLSRGRVCPAYP